MVALLGSIQGYNWENILRVNGLHGYHKTFAFSLKHGMVHGQ